jgi:serine/threonine protein kinase
MDDLEELDETIEARVGALVDERYRLVEVIGRGGMGAIYRAEDVVSGTEVAIKALHPYLASDRMVVERFRR